MTHANGTIQVTHNVDSGPDIHFHTVGEFEGTENENGTYDFEAGPLEPHHHNGEGSEQWIRASMGGGHSTVVHEVDYSQCEDFERPFPGDAPHACTGPEPVEAHHDGDDVVVTWEHNRDPGSTEYYTVYRTLVEDRDFREIDRVDANETSYRDENVTAGEEYAYTVTGLHAQTGREDDPYDHAIITAQGDEPEPPVCPGGLRAEAHSNEGITLSWNACQGADTYHVYRATGDGAFVHVSEVTGTSYTDTDTEAETTYTYEVTAANDVGESADCSRVGVTATPFFGTPAIIAMAILGSVGIVVILGARRG